MSFELEIRKDGFITPDGFYRFVKELQDAINNFSFTFDTIDWTSGGEGDSGIVLNNNLNNAMRISNTTSDYVVYNTMQDKIIHSMDIELIDDKNIIFSSTSTNNNIIVPDALLDAFSIKTPTKTFLTIDSRVGMEELLLPCDVRFAQNGQIDGNLTIDGDLSVLGTTTTIDTANLSVEDCVIEICRNNTITDIVDSGIYTVYNSSGVKYGGLIRDASESGKWNLVENLTVPPSEAIADYNPFLARLDADVLAFNSLLPLGGSLNIDSNLTLTSTANNELRITDTTGVAYSGFKTPATLTGTSLYTLPADYPASDSILQSSSTGILSWISSNPFDQALNTTSSPTFDELTLSGSPSGDGDLTLTLGNIILSAVGATVDGVDLSAFKTDYDSKINQALLTTSGPTFASLTVNGNIVTTGTVDGIDVSDLNTTVNMNTSDISDLQSDKLNRSGTPAMTGNLDMGNFAVNNTNLTANRLVLAGTSGNLVDSANITYDLTETKISLHNNAVDATSASLLLQKSRNSLSTSLNDQIGELRFDAFDSDDANVNDVINLIASVDEAPSSGLVRARLDLNQKINASTIRTRMKIDKDGNMTLGDNLSASDGRRLSVQGDFQANNNTILGTGTQLAVGATDGFLYLGNIAGKPTGNSTDFTDRNPITYSPATNSLYVNSTGTTWNIFHSSLNPLSSSGALLYTSAGNQIAEEPCILREGACVLSIRDATNQPTIQIDSTGNNTQKPTLRLQKRKGVATSVTSDELGTINWQGYNGSYLDAANISVIVDGTVGANVPSNMQFSAGADNSTILQIFGNDDIALGKSAQLSASDSNGFAFFRNIAGVPIGTPTPKTGLSALTYSPDNSEIYAYNGASWDVFSTSSSTAEISLGDIANIKNEIGREYNGVTNPSGGKSGAHFDWNALSLSGLSYGKSISMSADGRVAAISNPTVSLNGGFIHGEVEVRRRSGNDWIFYQSLRANGADAGANFGSSTSITNDSKYVVVGANLFSTIDTNNGSAYIFERSSDTTKQYFSPLVFSEQTATFTQRTAQHNQDGVSWQIFDTNATANNNSAYIGFGIPFSKLTFDNVGQTAGIGSSIVWEYWNGAWTSLTGVTDGTSGFTAGPSDGQEVTFTQPTDWQTTVLDVETGGLYWIRARMTSVFTTAPVYDQAFISQVDPSAYSLVKTLNPTDTTANVRFGTSAAISSDGTWIAIGANEETRTSPNLGRVSIYKKSGSDWIEQQVLTGSDSSDGDQFGQSVSITNDGEFLAVGANKGDKIYLFKRTENTFNEIQIITESQEFGSKVILSGAGDVLIVSAPLDDTTGTDEGKVYVYSKDRISCTEDRWIEDQQITVDIASGNPGIGLDMALSKDGNYLAIGAQNEEKVYLYVRKRNQFMMMTIVENGINASLFGEALAISNNGEHLLVGASDEDIHGTADGTTYFYQSNSNITLIEHTLKIKSNETDTIGSNIVMEHLPHDTGLSDGDSIGKIEYFGEDSDGDRVTAGSIEMKVDGAPTASNVASKLEFTTIDALGTASTTIIDKDGNFSTKSITSSTLGTSGAVLYSDGSGVITEEACFTRDSDCVFTLTSASADEPIFQIENTATSDTRSFIKFKKQRNGAVVTTGDDLGDFVWEAFNNAPTYVSAASIVAEVDIDGVGANVPTKMIVKAGSNHNQLIGMYGNNDVGIGVNTTKLAAAATDGFVHIRSAAGTPTGTPTNRPGVHMVPITYAPTTKTIYTWNGSSWDSYGTRGAIIESGTGTFNLDDSHYLVMFSNTGGITVNLPDIKSGDAKQYVIIKTGIGSAVVIAPHASDSINGASPNFSLGSQHDSVRLVANGVSGAGRWYTV